tara:strand:+ start:26 stop:283 length:258 start_codon:yes stop_codon:yes gene_type:complete
MMKIIEVKWEDAWVDTIDISISEVKKLKPIIRTTVGWRISENKEGIILATDYFNDDKKYINTPMCIPWGIILEYWEYEINDTDNS